MNPEQKSGRKHGFVIMPSLLLYYYSAEVIKKIDKLNSNQKIFAQ